MRRTILVIYWDADIPQMRNRLEFHPLKDRRDLRLCFTMHKNLFENTDYTTGTLRLLPKTRYPDRELHLPRGLFKFKVHNIGMDPVWKIDRKKIQINTGLLPIFHCKLKEFWIWIWIHNFHWGIPCMSDFGKGIHFSLFLIESTQQLWHLGPSDMVYACDVEILVTLLCRLYIFWG